MFRYTSQQMFPLENCVQMVVHSNQMPQRNQVQCMSDMSIDGRPQTAGWEMDFGNSAQYRQKNTQYKSCAQETFSEQSERTSSDKHNQNRKAQFVQMWNRLLCIHIGSVWVAAFCHLGTNITN
eukprot:m.74091 g.74091  ORF g.74091 m.74091 type:complete len:123 (-) comp11791_c0_seq6:1536-1904(-)